MRPLVIAGFLCCATNIFAQQAKTTAPDSALKRMSFEELMEIEVTSVSKRPERLIAAASAIQVITNEDIRRSGALNLPQALRLASNLMVAQFNAHDWAVTARGFNGVGLSNNTLADKLLVMIDGRSIYTPFFGGVFWDVQGIVLEDIDRIEVVSGPGGTLWGANAVNGVINIVTKNAEATQGLYVTTAAGTAVQDHAAIRYGNRVSDRLAYRVYAQRHDGYSSNLPNGGDAKDKWNMTQLGFRTDYQLSDANALTIQGDAYLGGEGDPTGVLINGQNVLGRWTHVRSDASDVTVQLYVDHTYRNFVVQSLRDEITTYDLDAQHRFPLGTRQSILWGGNVRFALDHVSNVPALSVFPAHRTLRLISGFVQDEIGIVPNRLNLTIGTKVERNEYTGVELQPSARLAWFVTPRQMLWTAVSRAVRAPSRFDADLFSPGLGLAGDPAFAAEKVVAYELGYRAQPRNFLSTSLALFTNRYTDIRSINLASGSPPLPFQFENDQRGTSSGIELSANATLSPWWRLRGGYTYFEKRLRTTKANVLAISADIEGNDPRNQLLLHSNMDLPGKIQTDIVTRFVDSLPNPAVRSYVTSDLRVARDYGPLELSVVGQNLWRRRQSEFGRTAIPRSVYGKLTFRR
jgi:iron complex outermembrane receptor protein